VAEDSVQTQDDAADPCRPTLKDRFIKRLVDLAVEALYRSVDMYLPAEEEDTCPPILSVSNHFGGFADPLLLMHAANRRPRIIARDKIWKIPIAGWVMKWLGAIPVHKPEEQNGRTSNDEMFASCYTALEDRKMLLIFPEGITRDDPSIAPIKTGAARIALGARAQGTDGLLIVPVGIHYEDKAASTNTSARGRRRPRRTEVPCASSPTTSRSRCAGFRRTSPTGRRPRH
jgi:1-acyl-sn-glycerol-3-phosphate acyltransferase